MIKFLLLSPLQKDVFCQLFSQTFADSESQEVGQMIGQLVEQLLINTSVSDKHVFIAMHDSELVGGVIFSRVSSGDQLENAFILSPMSIKTAYQGQGIGQQLIKYGIKQLKQIGAEILLTYGDPNFYGKVGFTVIDETLIRAPFPLSFPHGWLAQSLNDKPIKKIDAPIQCVKALMNDKYW